MAQADLKPVRTKDEAKKRGANGGRASGVARRKKRDLRACLVALLDARTEDGRTGSEVMAAQLYSAALSGDVKAIKLFAELAGHTRQTVSFTLPEEVNKAAGLSQMSAAVVKAVAEGKLTPDEGAKLATLMTAHSKCVEDSELEARIARLEAAHEKSDAACR